MRYFAVVVGSAFAGIVFALVHPLQARAIWREIREDEEVKLEER